MSELLVSRGISSAKVYRSWLCPGTSGQEDPFKLSDMQKAIDSLNAAITENKNICIYGDYDVDGVCATVILYKTLRTLTEKVSWYIPSRQNEGFGMHEASIKSLAEQGTDLIITVDNGISAVEEAKLAYSLGMKLIITDHHRFSGTLPVAEAIVASSRENYNTQINDLSGAGVAWMVAKALTGQSLDEYLPYVALAIAADSVRVTKYNRDYLKLAFPMFTKDEHFKLLLHNASADTSEINMRTLNFVFAPRINAAGRIAHANIALRYFLSDDTKEMLVLANELELLNQQRKNEETRIFEECIATGEPNGHVLVFFGEDWNTGVVGIVASRLVEKYHKNVFVLGRSPSGEYVGSGRNDTVTDLYTLILPCASVLTRFGGHAGAAGLSVLPENLQEFINIINASFEVMYPDGTPSIPFYYDMEVGSDECSVELAKEISLLAPFGSGNPEPVFRLPHASIHNVSRMGKAREHISGTFNTSPPGENENGIRVVSFGNGGAFELWNSTATMDILVSLNLNTFRNRESCEGKLVAFNIGLLDSEPSYFIDLINAFFENLQYNDKSRGSCAEKICSFLEYPALTEERLRQLFLILFYRYGLKCRKTAEASMGTAEEFAALLIFKEMGLVSTEKGKISFIASENKKDCHDSILFTVLNNHLSGGKNNGTR